MKQESRRALFISYFFPPIGGTGVLRVLKFVKYLPAFGWNPSVLTVKQGFYPVRDESLLKEIPNEAEVTRINYFEPGLWFKFRFWRSFWAYFFYPNFLFDNQAFWILPAFLRGLQIIKKEKPEVIFTSSSSYSDHIVAWLLKKTTGVRWAADFRDEWPFTGWQKPLKYLLAKVVLRNADKVISVSDGLTANYQKILGRDKGKFETITNGFDEEDFAKIRLLKPEIRKNRTLRITHIGSLYGSRKADAFFEALKRLNLKDIEVELVGQKKKVPHREAIQKMFSADVLLLVLAPQDGPAVLTGKLFEYLATKKPILALASKNSGAAELIVKLKAGEIAQPDDVRDIQKKIKKIYENYKKNRLFIPRFELDNFERKKLTGKLAKIFDRLVSSRAPIKICLIGNIQAPQNQNLCQGLINENFEVIFITTKPGKIKFVKSYYLGQPFFTPWYFLRSLLRIKKIIKITRPDIVHGQDLVFAGIWAHLAGFKPYIVSIWGSDINNYQQFIWPERTLIRRTLRQATQIIGTSLAIGRAAEKLGADRRRFNLIHFGIDMDIFRLMNPTKSGIVFCPRAIGPVYNTLTLVNAFGLLSRQRKELKLALIENVADDDYLEKVEKLAIKKDLLEKIMFWPKVKNNQMPKYYARSEVVVSIPSSDGCSMSFLEAMACGKKIVVSDLPYIKEWQKGKNLWTVPIKDAAKTAEAIKRALDFPKNRWQKTGQSNRELVIETAEKDKNLAKMAALYREIIRR